jgi:hypothetical protein
LPVLFAICLFKRAQDGRGQSFHFSQVSPGKLNLAITQYSLRFPRRVKLTLTLPIVTHSALDSMAPTTKPSKAARAKTTRKDSKPAKKKARREVESDDGDASSDDGDGDEGSAFDGEESDSPATSEEKEESPADESDLEEGDKKRKKGSAKKDAKGKSKGKEKDDRNTRVVKNIKKISAPSENGEQSCPSEAGEGALICGFRVLHQPRPHLSCPPRWTGSGGWQRTTTASGSRSTVRSCCPSLQSTTTDHSIFADAQYRHALTNVGGPLLPRPTSR